MNRELISKAVQGRVADVCARLNSLDADHFGDGGSMVSPRREFLLSELRGARNFPALVPFDRWVQDEGEPLTSFQILSVCNLDVKNFTVQPPVAPFLDELTVAAAARQSFFPLLTKRYACPLNFSFPGEADVREFVLMRLMVADRARIEGSSVAAVDADDLLLKLCLASVHASMTTDLRFLDALNYYYELLPASWYPNTEYGWLWPFYLALYARALFSWS